jgi:hypothetical protein
MRKEDAFKIMHVFYSKSLRNIEDGTNYYFASPFLFNSKINWFPNSKDNIEKNTYILDSKCKNHEHCSGLLLQELKVDSFAHI